ncbi:MAG: family N-acetyltransferase, partial [Planctomycetaceae bacterium]|nr:family N-acetyltransferase [Planctomycetaceae bacterium]
MNLTQLTERMRGWLQGEYRAVVFEAGNAAVGYALFRRDPDFMYLRQLFIARERRRQAIGRDALGWLWHNAWNDAKRLRIDVLAGNAAGIAFWRSVGFLDYCITMEAMPPHVP